MYYYYATMLQQAKKITEKSTFKINFALLYVEDKNNRRDTY